MRALKFVRNLVTRCVALLAIIVPVPKAAGQTPHTEGEKPYSQVLLGFTDIGLRSNLGTASFRSCRFIKK
jgi:hypothetical protein